MTTVRTSHRYVLTVLLDMFHLWYLAESDLLSENVPYRLRDTGQGLNRVQAAPKTSRMMHAILNRAQRSIGSWVGSSVIHMGDHNVPNALKTCCICAGELNSAASILELNASFCAAPFVETSEVSAGSMEAVASYGTLVFMSDVDSA